MREEFIQSTMRGKDRAKLGWIVICVVLCVAFGLASRQGNIRIKKENDIKRLEIELALRKEETKRLEIMANILHKPRYNHSVSITENDISCSECHNEWYRVGEKEAQ